MCVGSCFPLCLCAQMKPGYAIQTVAAFYLLLSPVQVCCFTLKTLKSNMKQSLALLLWAQNQTCVKVWFWRRVDVFAHRTKCLRFYNIFKQSVYCWLIVCVQFITFWLSHHQSVITDSYCVWTPSFCSEWAAVQLSSFINWNVTKCISTLVHHMIKVTHCYIWRSSLSS